MDGLAQRVTAVKHALQVRIDALAAKQDEFGAAQDALQRQLAAVGGDVEDTKAGVARVSAGLDLRV